MQISPQWKIRSLRNLKLKLKIEKVTPQKILVKIRAQTRTHEAKMCACVLKRAHTHIYASFAHDFRWNFMKIVLIGHYYVLTFSLKFHKDLSFCCGDICKIPLNMHARGIIEHAKFQHLRLHVFAFCAGIWALIFIKNFLVVHYSVISLSFKFHKELIFRCRDICKIEWGFFWLAL